MNQALIQQYIAQYKRQFTHIHHEEIYKWQAVQHFKKVWDQDEKDFALMLTNALSKASNLLDSRLYYPRIILIESAEAEPELVRAAFSDLYNESIALQERIETFRKRIKNIFSAIKPNKKHYQDDRAILVYLSLQYPDTHYFYKFGVLKAVCEKVEHDYTPIGGRFTNIDAFYDICSTLKQYIISDPDLLRYHFDRLSENNWPDTNFNILTQDFMYAIDNYLVLENDLLTKPLEKTGDKVNTISDLFELQKPIDFSTPHNQNEKKLYLLELFGIRERLFGLKIYTILDVKFVVKRLI